MIQTCTNRLLITFLSEILTYLDIDTQSFQKEDNSLANCMRTLKKVQEELNLMKSEYSLRKSLILSKQML